MGSTYVFDLYNLYIPEGSVYKNNTENVRITPLRLAKEFEQNRYSPNSKYHDGDWITSKCYVKKENEEDAQEVASWISFLCSFAQSRKVYWDTYYPHNQGYERKREYNTRLPPIHNQKSPLIGAIYPSGNNELGPFLDSALDTLRNSGEEERDDIISTIFLYLASKARGLFAAKFLFAWICIERNAEWNYRDYLDATSNHFIQQNIREDIQNEINEVISSYVSGDKIEIMENRLTRSYLYEHRTIDKIKIYLDHLQVDVDDQVMVILNRCSQLRNDIAHQFNDDELSENEEAVYRLQRILSFIILDKLGISEGLLQRMVINTSADQPDVSLPNSDSFYDI